MVIQRFRTKPVSAMCPQSRWSSARVCLTPNVAVAALARPNYACGRSTEASCQSRVREDWARYLAITEVGRFAVDVVDHLGVYAKQWCRLVAWLACALIARGIKPARGRDRTRGT